MAKYKKAFVALGGFLAVLGAVLSDGAVSADEGVSLFAAGLAAVGVFFAKNAPPA